MAVRAKTIVLSILVVLVLLVLLVIGAISAIGWQIVLGPDARPVSSQKFEVTPERLARGKYLAEGPVACFNCHTEHDFSNPEYPINLAKKGAGWSMPIPELNNIPARNITPDPETGIGTWSDDEIARAIREGVRKDGSALFPVMPYPYFAKLDDEDVISIVVYLRTLQPVRNVLPTRQLPGPLEYIVKTMPKPIVTPQPSHPASTAEQRGEYLVTIAHCRECHSAAVEGQIIPGLDFGGGGRFDLPTPDKLRVFSLNITPDPSGIAHYDETLFLDMMKTGRVPGRMVNHIMPLPFFKNMTDDDIKDIFAFLKTLKPVQHRVSNTDPPTKCAVCNETHGLGELNVKK